jgi:hypothetical protein
MSRLLLALLMLSASTAIADDNLRLFAADINVQTVLTFQVSDAVAEKMLPAGWELNFGKMLSLANTPKPVVFRRPSKRSHLLQKSCSTVAKGEYQ